MQEPERGQERAPRRAIDLSPKAIIRHNALTVREKIELLEDLRLQLGGDLADGTAEFDTADIDAALTELRRTTAAGRTAPMQGAEPTRHLAGGRL